MTTARNLSSLAAHTAAGLGGLTSALVRIEAGAALAVDQLAVQAAAAAESGVVLGQVAGKVGALEDRQEAADTDLRQVIEKAAVLDVRQGELAEQHQTLRCETEQV